MEISDILKGIKPLYDDALIKAKKYNDNLFFQE